MTSFELAGTIHDAVKATPQNGIVGRRWISRTSIELLFNQVPGDKWYHQLYRQMVPRHFTSKEFKRRVQVDVPRRTGDFWTIVVHIDALESTGDDSRTEAAAKAQYA